MRFAPLIAFAALSLLSAACVLSLSATTALPAEDSPRTSELLLNDRMVTEGIPPVTIVRQVWLNSYGVKGSNLDEVREALRRHSPVRDDSDGHFDALSEWAMHWSFRYDRSGGECRLAAATIEIQVNVTVPVLIADEGLTELHAAWRVYREAIDVHEQGHIETQLAAAAILAEELREAPAADTCTELGAYLAAIGQARIAATQAVDDAYDAETGHGRRQGAVLD